MLILQVHRGHALSDAAQQLVQGEQLRAPAGPAVVTVKILSHLGTGAAGEGQQAGKAEQELGAGHGPRKEFFEAAGREMAGAGKLSGIWYVTHAPCFPESMLVRPAAFGSRSLHTPA